ncbi:DNA-3-methyladenine glycosylase [Salibacterium halotolerans]|uniref:Putative 3-methyladenine DNA glycosylase n=1 Tax=Salibacterium halotolerans TaxID=1884432 RepID=A0A1I5RR18_9BACI|nr:DNA-3-methyladenine glycosylase [Salibacterium halotolerans]SFP60982.1 DNA-3-methyladenine glycosylase [Salibacterium halotolerans]
MECRDVEKIFYGSTLQVAQNLLGCLLVKETKDGKAAGKIVETEAYLGEEDRAAHSFENKRTKRTEIMFHAPGHVYVFEMHTHCLVNVVSAPAGVPQAVLIRALEPVEGIDLMRSRRKRPKDIELTNGPGKLTKALGITMEDYGRHFSGETLYIMKGKRPEEISSGPRIGIENTGEAKDYPYRFWETENRFISK